MGRMKNIINSSGEYTESFYGFRGIAPLGDETVKNRLAYCENVFRNYDSDTAGAIESVPGYRLLASLDGEINGLHSDGELYVHGGGELHKLTVGEDKQTVSLTKIGELRDAKSHSFCLGGHLYIIDGESIRRVKRGTSVLEDAVRYTPTLYHNGEPYEQRNLLTDSFREEYEIADGRAHITGSRGLHFSITDGDLLLCSLSGADEDIVGELDVPGYTIINGIEYRVTEICDRVFEGNTEITRVRIAEGVERIGAMAFYDCASITAVSTPRSLKDIGGAAFNGCLELADVYLRRGLATIGNSAFVTAYNLSTVHFEGSEADWEYVAGTEQLAAVEKSFLDTDPSINATFAIGSVPKSIKRVTVGDETVGYRVLKTEGVIDGISIPIDRHWEYNGKRLVIEGMLNPMTSDFNGGADADGIAAEDAILGCTVTAVFDGRVFLAGNPSLPNTVFYSARGRDGRMDPTYFGEYNYFNDGSGSAAVTSIIGIGDSLAVFKERDGGDGSIFYHKPLATGEDLIPTVYPVLSIHTGIEIFGRAISFMDEAVFLSPSGLMAIEKQQVNYERSIVCRSSNINAYLLKCDLSKALLTSYMGYLAVACGEYIFLADPRATFVGSGGNLEYEWYIVKGVGRYTDKTNVYRYGSSPGVTQLKLKTEKLDEPVEDQEIYYVVIGGNHYYFTQESDGSYIVYKTDELRYGGFEPAERYFAHAGRLYFKNGGELYVFNSDLYGVLPKDRIGDSEAEASEALANRLHPYFYTFDGIRPRYIIKTVKTYCGIPHLTKSTVRNSLVIKYGGVSEGSLICEVGTDRTGYSECARIYGVGLSFAEIDFSTLSLSPPLDLSVPIGEREKGWVEKDITVYSDGDACPIAIYSIAYRYKIKGRIKKG